MGEFKIIHIKDMNTMTQLERSFYNYREEYTIFEFSNQTLSEIQPNLTKVRRWIEKECNDEVVVILTKNSGHFYSESMIICFEDETDAAAFKLKWM